MSTFYVRPSMLLSADECRRQMALKYIFGVRTEAMAANLAFGTALDVAVKAQIESLVTRQPVNAVMVFREAWAKAQAEHRLAYSAKQAPDLLTATGTRLMELFPKAWEESGLVPLMGTDGNLNMSRRMATKIAPGVVLTGEIDFNGINSSAETAIVDFKSTAGQPADYAFTENSDQTTAYNILADANAELLGCERVDLLGFMYLVKRDVPTGNNKRSKNAKGPEVLQPVLVPSRTAKQKAEFRQKVIWLVEDIQRGRFPKASRSPHNTPCNTCEYAAYCAEGDTSGLVIPNGAQLGLLEAA